MKVRPPTLERPLAEEGAPSPEVLFKAARRRRRRRYVVGALAVALAGGLVVVFAPLSTSPTPHEPTAHGSTSPSHLLALPVCRSAQLGLNAVPAPGAMTTGGEILIYVNETSRACELSGYPSITAVTMRTGATLRAKHEITGFLNGSKHNETFPRVVLSGRGALASSVVQYEGAATDTTVLPRCVGPRHHVLAVHDVRVDAGVGASQVLHLSMGICNTLVANPFVPGATGRWSRTAFTPQASHPTPTAEAGHPSPPCSAAQLRASSGGTVELSGTSITTIEVTNARAACYLGGFPMLLVVRPDGDLVGLAVAHASSPYLGGPGGSVVPATVATGASGRLVLFSPYACNASPPGGSNSTAATIHVLRIELPGNGGWLQVPVPVDAACEVSETPLGMSAP